MKHISLWLALIVLSFSSCYEEADWLGDNTTPGAGNFPVISLLEITNGEEFAVGETVDISLYFFSTAEIDNIVLARVMDETETEIETFGYQPNFDEVQQADRLDMSYTIPTDTTAGSTITLLVRITNKNGLTRERELDVSVI